MLTAGVAVTLMEAGFVKVLKELKKRIEESVQALPVYGPASLVKAIGACWAKE